MRRWVVGVAFLVCGLDVFPQMRICDPATGSESFRRSCEETRLRISKMIDPFVPSHVKCRRHLDDAKVRDIITSDLEVLWIAPLFLDGGSQYSCNSMSVFWGSNTVVTVAHGRQKYRVSLYDISDVGAEIKKSLDESISDYEHMHQGSYPCSGLFGVFVGGVDAPLGFEIGSTPVTRFFDVSSENRPLFGSEKSVHAFLDMERMCDYLQRLYKFTTPRQVITGDIKPDARSSDKQ
ncbi:MAG: hypothetical protein K6G91_02140 [Kiritimatiellae bacterium]|nr:hypothetical protein [Kiritimatiellia bacterium]